jgi:hypothetical protein
MSDDVPQDAAPRRPASSVNTLRAGIVVGCFVLATVLLLGPASHVVAGTPSATTPTTQPPPPVVRSTTTVQVVNGTVATGKAEQFAQDLNTAGWDALPAEDVSPAPTSATQATVTYVYFLPHQQPAAQLVATDLGVPAAHVKLRTRQVLDTVQGAAKDDVVVILGTDLAH